MNNVTPSIFDNTPEHPIQSLHAWLADASAHKVLEPTAAALATANHNGIASNRVVQILDVSEAGLVFATHINSPKGMDIEDTRWGACVFYWPQIKRQIIVSGNIKRLDDCHSDCLWAARPPESHAMSIVSTQSALLQDEDVLLQAALAVTVSETLIRPTKWVGFLLESRVVEFWQFSYDRLYKRLKYTWVDGQWTFIRLQP